MFIPMRELSLSATKKLNVSGCEEVLSEIREVGLHDISHFLMIRGNVVSRVPRRLIMCEILLMTQTSQIQDSSDSIICFFQ